MDLNQITTQTQPSGEKHHLSHWSRPTFHRCVCALHKQDNKNSDDRGSTPLWNVGLFQRDYTALYSRRPHLQTRRCKNPKSCINFNPTLLVYITKAKYAVSHICSVASEMNSPKSEVARSPLPASTSCEERVSKPRQKATQPLHAVTDSLPRPDFIHMPPFPLPPSPLCSPTPAPTRLLHIIAAR
jgi:hypothetical protein